LTQPTSDGKPEIDRRIGNDNAQALTKPPYFAHLEFDFVDCWERLGKELKVSKHQANRTESTGHMFLVRAHNPKVVSSNLTPATIYLSISSSTFFCHCP
jgi:hypothetical protein